jgi:uncharacterized protein YdeI (BOF family)
VKKAMKTLTRSMKISGGFLAALCLAIGAGADEKPNPYAKPDESWISLSGTVRGVTADQFTLDYGDGWITVEMDDGDRDADGYALLNGDKVVVNGMVDDDFFQTTTIEARSVYVEKLGTWFYASAADEEEPDFLHATPVVLSAVTVQGTVTSVTPDAKEFTVDTGLRQLTVSVEGMAYDPLDDDGYQKIRTGDVVRVHGQMDRKLVEGRQLVAGSVTKVIR